MRDGRAGVLAALALIAALPWACSGTDTKRAGEAERAPARAAEPPPVAPPAAPALPVLRVGTSADYAPFSKDGAGFDIDVATRLAADLGHRIEWVRFSWPELQARIAANDFDVAMSGVTLRPDRSLVGYMTRAVASGGPCVLGDARSRESTVAVNRGGILERWARGRFAAPQLRTVDDNLSLPGLLERGEVNAIVTDSFEAPHFARPGVAVQCEPPRDRKVYWVSPARAAELGPRIDAWLAAHDKELQPLRTRWLGGAAGFGDAQHLVDLLERRLALMPAVAAYKRANGLPIEDKPREAVVLQQSLEGAAAQGLDPASVRALFEAQIALSKAVQARAKPAEPLDLDQVLRPALSSLGDRILAALAASSDALPGLQPSQLDLLEPWLNAKERARLLAALRAVRTR